MKTKRSRPVSIIWSIRNEVGADRETDSWGLPAVTMSRGPLLLWLLTELWRLCLGKCLTLPGRGPLGGSDACDGIPWLIGPLPAEAHFIHASPQGFFFGGSLSLLLHKVLSGDLFGGFQVGKFVFISEIAV